MPRSPSHTATITKQLEVLKRELNLARRVIQRIDCADSDSHENRDEAARALEIASTALFEIELAAQPATDEDGQLLAA